MDTLQQFTLEKFMGVNKGTTETLLEFGEATSMINWQITDDYKLQKMFGYMQRFASLGAFRINGMWYGMLGGVLHFCFAANGRVFVHNLATGANTDIGGIANAFPTTFFAVNNLLYILDGTNYYSWSGTGNIAVAAGYVPTVITASPPAGGGTLLEAVNYLTGQKTQRFSGNGTATVYQLSELAVDSVNDVFVNGVRQTAGFTVNLANGTVTFAVAPSAGTNNVQITWTKVTPGDRERITQNRYYGGAFFARHWIFGNPTRRNTRFPSGVTMAGISDPTYWPRFSESDVGQHEITDIVAHDNRQLIFTSDIAGKAAAWFSSSEDIRDPFTGAVITLFPVYPLNAEIGNIAKGQVQIIVNHPFTLWQGVYRWVPTNVLDQRSAEWMSRPVQYDLDKVNLAEAITVNWADKGQYWLCVGRMVWVYNYRVGTWHILELPDTPTCFVVAEQQLYFGTTNGQIMRFDEGARTYNGALINATWTMGFYNFGAEWRRKFINRLFLSFLPEGRARVNIQHRTDFSATSETLTAVLLMHSFAHTDFRNFSFLTNYSPQPFRYKLRVKKASYFRLILTNNTQDNATVLAITLPVRFGGEVKNRRW